jgi:hypothetical protein
MSQYSFTTREIGPNPKGLPLTFDELDESLLFLSSSLIPSSSVNNLSQSIVELTAEVLILSQSINEIDFHPLSGSNYIFVEANGTPIQNANYLTASYNLAKSTNPTGSDRFSVLLGPGYYEFTNDFIIDTEYIDVVSLTGDRDVYITGSSTIVIGADNVYVRGIDVDTKNFTITSSFPNTIIKNCKGGDESFGGNPNPLAGFVPNPGYFIANTFIDCEGGDRSFAGNGSAYGTFINCIGGDESFGNFCDGIFTDCVSGDNSFATLGNIEGGTLENCTGGDNSFAPIGNIGDFNLTQILQPKLKECVGGINSFASSGIIYGLLQECQLTLGNFNILNIDPISGQLVSCYGNGFTPITTP